MADGKLFLIVGPSGAGKDTLLNGARRALAGDPRFVFARRVITRPAEAGGENHEAVTPDAFEERRRAGEFMLSWHAHGLDYGLPASLADDLAAGRNVIANVSRTIVAEAAARFSRLLVVEVTAPEAVRAARLARRGRETAARVADRLARDGAELPPEVPRITIANDEETSPERGVARFVAALTGGDARCSG